MKVTHFKPGDRVRLLRDLPGLSIKKGDVGTVSEPVIPKSLIPDDSVMVRFETGGPCQFGKIRFTNTVCVRECDLVPSDVHVKTAETAGTSTVRHIVFDITTDGGEAKYIDGKNIVRKAKIKRSSEDEPNDFDAMMYLIGKLFPESEMKVSRLPEKETDDNLPPAVEGYIAVRDMDGDPAYVSLDRIENIVETEEDGSKIVLVYTASENRYEIPGHTLSEVMDMIKEARGW